MTSICRCSQWLVQLKFCCVQIVIFRRQGRSPPPLAVPPGRPVAMGGRGGFSPPLENWSPPLGCAVPFAVTIGIEVYPPPWNSVSPPC